MDKAREMIEDAIWEVTDEGTFDHSVNSNTQVGAITEAILGALPEVIKGMVKPLEWETANETMYWCHTAYGRYSVFETFEGEGYVGLPGSCGAFQIAGGLTAAIEAANAHNVAQVLKALSMGEAE